MFLDYKVGLVPKNIGTAAAIIAIRYDDQNKDGYLKASVVIPFETKTIYKSVHDAKKIITAYKVIWKGTITHLIVHIADNLLTNPRALEHIIAAISGAFLENVYKQPSKERITLTHDGGKIHPSIVYIAQLIEKVQIGKAMSMLPANMGTPEQMATKLQKIFKALPNTTTTIHKTKYLKTHGYNLIHAIGKGSQHPPCMLVVERKARTAPKTVCIVGKGITFDTGGVNLKSFRAMDGMKYDKTGAIYGAMALAHLIEDDRLANCTLVGIFPFAENALSHKAVFPGDVITSLLGKTVEIANTDAEGRLILADALAHAHRYTPDLIIDIATLTGHADLVNCWHNGYCFVHPETLKMPFEKTCESIGERMLTMPNWNDYSDVLKSKVADLVNYSSTCGDAFTAALFLKEFVPPKSDWIHIDISHNLTNGLPRGNGIRSVVRIVSEYIEPLSKN